MSHDLEDQICELLATELCVDRARLGAGIRLVHDLGCDGDDARELLARYAQEFRVDLAHFDPALHFGPEAAFNPVLYLYWWFFRPERLRFVPLTIGDLVGAARAGSLRNSERAVV